MTGITDYTTLQSAAADFLNRADLTAVVPTFIQLAEVQLNRKLRCRQQITKTPVTINSEFVTAPTDIAKTVYLKYTDYPALPLRYSEPGNMPLQSSGITGRPRIWTLERSPENFRFSYVPDASYAAEYLYFAKLPALSVTTTTNWLLDMAPDIYLYGALTQSAPYLREDSRLAVWGALYQAAVAEAMAANKVAEQLLRADEAASMSGNRGYGFNINTGM